MIRVVVDHDLVASPVPALNDVVIVRSDVPIEIAKPEAFAVSSHKVESKLRSNTTGEMSVCPRLSELVMRIVAATIMSDPFIVLDVNVRNVRVTLPVHGNVVPGIEIGRASCRERV